MVEEAAIYAKFSEQAKKLSGRNPASSGIIEQIDPFFGVFLNFLNTPRG
jgi:hypothetical protein